MRLTITKEEDDRLYSAMEQVNFVKQNLEGKPRDDLGKALGLIEGVVLNDKASPDGRHIGAKRKSAARAAEVAERAALETKALVDTEPPPKEEEVEEEESPPTEGGR